MAGPTLASPKTKYEDDPNLQLGPYARDLLYTPEQTAATSPQVVVPVQESIQSDRPALATRSNGSMMSINDNTKEQAEEAALIKSEEALRKYEEALRRPVATGTNFAFMPAASSQRVGSTKPTSDKGRISEALFGAAPGAAPDNSAIYTDVKTTPKQDAVATDPTVSTPASDDFAAFIAKYAGGGGGGGTNLKVSPGMKAAYAAHKGAIKDDADFIAKQQPGIEATRADVQKTGQEHIEGLEKLNTQRKQVDDARRMATGRDAQARTDAENSFDASRVLRNIGNNPIATGALSFVAGLVGAMNGAAGNTSANQVLAEVDKAVERDVMNQKEQYARMLDGQAFARSDYADARQMGANDAAALAVSVAASMDQHKRALGFADSRIANSGVNSALRQSIAVLDQNFAKMEMDIQAKNAAAAAAAQQRKASMMIAQMSAGQPTEQERTRAQALVTHVIDSKPWKEAVQGMKSVSGIREELSVMNKNELDDLWDPSFTKSVRDALANVDKGTASPFLGSTLANYISGEMTANLTASQNRVRALQSKIANAYYLAFAGKAVSGSEASRMTRAIGATTTAGFNKFIDDTEVIAQGVFRDEVESTNLTPLAKAQLSNIALQYTPRDTGKKEAADTSELAADQAPGPK